MSNLENLNKADTEIVSTIKNVAFLFEKLVTVENLKHGFIYRTVEKIDTMIHEELHLAASDNIPLNEALQILYEYNIDDPEAKEGEEVFDSGIFGYQILMAANGNHPGKEMLPEIWKGRNLFRQIFLPFLDQQ